MPELFGFGGRLFRGGRRGVVAMDVSAYRVHGQ